MSEELTCIIDSKQYYLDPNFDVNHKTNKIDIDKLLSDMVVKGASDLHLKSPTGPVYRIDGELDKQNRFEVTPQDVENVFHHVAADAHQKEFYAHNEVDFIFYLWRCQVSCQRASTKRFLEHSFPDDPF